jgi:glycosidase
MNRRIPLLRTARERSATITIALLAALAAGSTGCMQLDDAQPITLGTHVQDWRDEIIYQILVDRFADGDQGNDYNIDPTSLAHYHGGDWKGIEDHLDYIQALGVTAIWISPVVKNVETDSGYDGFHGYWTQDFTQPNPHFGDVPALRHMVASAHAVGIKVILDIVTNHMGQLFFYDINKTGEPAVNISGGGCDKWDNPSDTQNLYPDYSSTNATCEVLAGQSGVTVVNEYDPEFDSSGVVQSYTSLGYSGPAPIVFLNDPVTNHMPPQPALFQNPDVFNRRGGTVNYSIGDQLVHGDFPGGLKDLATYRCDVKEAELDAYATWVELADFDGLRIDTVKHVEPEFWRYFSQRMRLRLAKEGKTNFLMFGEAFDGDDTLVGSFTKNGATPQVPAEPQYDTLGNPDLANEQKCVSDGVALTGDMLDSAFYFPQYYDVVSNVLRDSGATNQIQSLWNARTADWGTVPAQGGVGIPPAQIPINFLDNHDVGRFLFNEFFDVDSAALAKGTINQTQFDQIRAAKLRNAYVFLFTEQGIPCVYYGDEQGFQGGNDPANREDLWPSGYAQTPTTDPVTGNTYGTFFPWIQQLTALRKKYRALSHGDQKIVWATNDVGTEADAGIFSYERAGGDAGDAYALIVLNTNVYKASSPTSGGSNMPVSAPAGTMLVDVLAEKPTTYAVAADGTLAIQVGALAAAVLVPESQVSGN